LEITAINRCWDEFSINLKFSWSLEWFAYKISKERKDEEQVQYRSYGVHKIRIFHGMIHSAAKEVRLYKIPRLKAQTFSYFMCLKRRQKCNQL